MVDMKSDKQKPKQAEKLPYGSKIIRGVWYSRHEISEAKRRGYDSPKQMKMVDENIRREDDEAMRKRHAKMRRERPAKEAKARAGKRINEIAKENAPKRDERSASQRVSDSVKKSADEKRKRDREKAAKLQGKGEKLKSLRKPEIDKLKKSGKVKT